MESVGKYEKTEGGAGVQVCIKLVVAWDKKKKKK